MPRALGGAGEGPRTFAAVTRILAERCASTAMIYLMHVCASQVIAAAKAFPLRESVLQDVARGRHLSTLAFSEKGSRSHFWAPVSQAVASGEEHRLTAEKSFVTSAGQADSYIVSTRSAGAAEPLARPHALLCASGRAGPEHARLVERPGPAGQCQRTDAAR